LRIFSPGQRKIFLTALSPVCTDKKISYKMKFFKLVLKDLLGEFLVLTAAATADSLSKKNPKSQIVHL
jgi:hypothetical protein